jgi:hypothetical protein
MSSISLSLSMETVGTLAVDCVLWSAILSGEVTNYKPDSVREGPWVCNFCDARVEELVQGLVLSKTIPEYIPKRPLYQ